MSLVRVSTVVWCGCRLVFSEGVHLFGVDVILSLVRCPPLFDVDVILSLVGILFCLWMSNCLWCRCQYFCGVDVFLWCGCQPVFGVNDNLFWCGCQPLFGVDVHLPLVWMSTCLWCGCPPVFGVDVHLSLVWMSTCRWCGWLCRTDSLSLVRMTCPYSLFVCVWSEQLLCSQLVFGENGIVNSPPVFAVQSAFGENDCHVCV